MNAPTRQFEIRTAEIFQSIQGEGPTAGRRALFIRTVGCTLDCIWCDTAPVWKQRGTVWTPAELAEHVVGEYRSLLTSGGHLILTGGSPLMQREGLLEFMECLSRNGVEPAVVECETEGTLIPHGCFSINQFNVSIKLENSGMSEGRRIKPQVILWHVDSGRSVFKFVVKQDSDLTEILRLQDRFSIPARLIWLMPCASTRTQHEKLAPTVVQLCKAYGFHFSPRLQVVIWDKVTGV